MSMSSRIVPVTFLRAIPVVPLMCLVIVASAAGENALIEMPATEVANAGFIGFGAEWDSYQYVGYGVTDADFKVIKNRLRYMRLPMARIMMLTRWCFPDGSTYDWNTPSMQMLYRQLDICQELGITVNLTDWGAEVEWTTAPGIEGVEDPLYAEVIGTYLDYLVNERGYTNIKYFTVTNEPNWQVGDWDRWKTGFLNVAAELEARGLDQHITLVASDTTAGDSDVSDIEPWHVSAVDELSDTAGMYSIHHYGKRARVRDGWREGPWFNRRDETFENWWRARWDYVRENDPDGAAKPCIVGEAGMDDDANHPSGSPYIDDYDYGVFMADYAVQATRAGSAAVLAWMLCDNAHEGFYWGMWTNREQGMQLRPWFYPWALLSRYFPSNATVYAPEQPDDIRVLAAEAAGSWSMCLVSRRDETAAVTVQTQQGAQARFAEYRYAEDERPADGQGFPVPFAEHETDAEGRLSLDLPAESVVVLRSVVLAPDVVGLQRQEAESAIVGAGMAIGEITLEHSDTIPEGSVIRQDPKPGAGLTEGATVSIVVSRGPLHMPTAGIAALILGGLGLGGLASRSVCRPRR